MLVSSSFTGLSHPTNDEVAWDPEDEGDHFPCGYEGWFYHAHIMLENGQQWDIAISFAYFMKKTRRGYSSGVSGYRIRHWNRQSGKYYDFTHADEFPGPFHTEKNRINFTYYNSSIRGIYPDYEIHCEDNENNFITNLRFHAISSPCFMLQESLDGIIPWGVGGTGRAYFVSVLEVIGNLTINGTLFNFTGNAYYEHDFADADLSNPFVPYSLKEFITGIKLIFSASRWRFSQVIENRQTSSPSLHRSNDYIIGWCWSWVVFNNDWSLVMWRPTVLRISEGRVPAFLHFTKDGENYTEFGCVYWHNKRIKYIERADIYIPLDFEVTAYKEDIKLHMIFNTTTEMTELYSTDFDLYTKQEGCTLHYCGTLEGYYIDRENNVSLKGSYAIEQTRWLPKFIMHRSLDIEILVPPSGLGISIKKVIHRLGFERFLKLQLIPEFEFIFYIKPAP